MMQRLHALLALLLMLVSVSALGQVQPAPSLMNFQGRLTKPDGTPVANGNYSVRFSLWTAATAGTEKWNQTVNPTMVRNGTFAVLLNVAAPTDLFYSNLWLEIKIGTAAPLTPRQQLVSVAFAMKANTVPDNAITSAKIANGTLTSTDFAAGLLDFWKLTGNSGTTVSHFLGTTDNKPLVLKANSRQVMRYEDVKDAGDTYHTVNVRGGAAINTIASGVLGATIAGGGRDNNSSADSPNEIWGNFGTISGGSGHFIDAYIFGTIAGGSSNIVQGNYSTISGGLGHNIQSNYATISGGANSYTQADYATIAGGDSNVATGAASAIGGGSTNTASGLSSTVGGGSTNTASGENATVAGGYHNAASFDDATVGGGFQNTARNYHATVAGGSGNDARGFASTVGGGNANYANADYAAIPGGYSNSADGIASFAAGHKAYAAHEGSFVWSDNSHLLDFFASTAPNQFCIQAYGGMVLETGQNAFLYTSSTVGEKNRYFMLLNSPLTQSASGLKAGGILCADSYGYANPGKNDLVVKGTASIGFDGPGSYKLSVNGAIFANGGYASSDARYKKDIVTLDNALDKILHLRGVNFDWDKDAWKEQNFPDGRQVGFIAQELEKVLPELVSTDPKGYKAVAYQNVIPVLVEAIKTLNGKVDALARENTELKKQNARIADFEKQLATVLAALKQVQAENIGNTNQR